MLLAIVTSIAMTITIIIFHYWALRAITALSKKHSSHFVMSVSVVLCLFAVHLVEISLYAIHIFGAYELFEFSGFAEKFSPSPNDYFHIAASSYSTLGMVTPTPINKLALVIDFISLTGFMMLTWSATYYYNIFSNSHTPD